MKNHVLMLAMCLLLLSYQVVRSEEPVEVLPRHPRTKEIKNPAEFFGFKIGSRHLRHDQVVAYLSYLADVSPRVALIPYGETHGKRPLMVAAISSAMNMERLDDLHVSRRQLTRGEYRGNVEDELLVMYMGYSVHGDESSAVNAAPLVAYHLVSSEHPEFSAQLEKSLFLVDPALNPDGVDRFANWANENRGVFPSASQNDREHNQPWPGGRTNYYWFDLNRDWLPAVHPESQGRLDLFHKWKPNVVLDFHEMSGNSSYFFQPGIAARTNPLTPERNQSLTKQFAKYHAKAMDTADELYYTEERFDDFYMGKGSTYPDLHGSVGILFEQGSTRGLQLTNDRTDRHFHDTVANQVRTSLSSVDAATDLRAELLEFQASFYSDALEHARQDVCKAYLLTGTESRLNAAAELLRRHRIVSLRPEESIQHDGRLLQPEEVLVVPTDQPEYFFLRSLMDSPQSFEENIFYDVSTWHLPSAFDLVAERIDHDVPETWLGRQVGGSERFRFAQRALKNRTRTTDAEVALAFSPLELGAPQLVAALHAFDAHLRVSTDEITVPDGDGGERILPRGTFFLLRKPNGRRWGMLANAAWGRATQLGVPVYKIQTGMTLEGPDLGSDTMLDIPVCRPALLVGDGTRSYSAGVLWHFLDQRLRQPSLRLDAERLVSTPLEDITCLIMPEGSYSNLGESSVDKLDRYLRDGGTVVAVGSSIRWLDRNELITLQDEQEPAGEKEAGGGFDWKPFAGARDERALQSIAGAFLMTEVDRTHPLGYGFPDQYVPVFRDHSSVFSLPRNPYQVAARYQQVIAGYVSEANRQRLAGTTAAWVVPRGRGRVICLADNPVFRGYVRGSERFLTNALYLGPAIAIPSRPGEEQESASDSGHHHHD